MVDIKEKLVELRERCSKCVHFHDELCEMANDTPDETALLECECFRARTNADRIRAMSDEEMVEWANKQIGCGFDYFPCGIVCEGKCKTTSDKECRAKILNWLQQPAEEVDHE